MGATQPVLTNWNAVAGSKTIHIYTHVHLQVKQNIPSQELAPLSNEYFANKLSPIP